MSHGRNVSHYRLHPWHGLDLGDKAPEVVNCYVEIVPTDTMKFELDKESGMLKIDRPQQYSNFCPCLYGLLPRTYCGQKVGDLCSSKIDRAVYGDKDPLDICILAEKTIVRGDIIVEAVPIGGLRLIDGDEADDKIIAVLKNDYVYGHYRDVSECTENMLDRIHHYFLTYKDRPGRDEPRHVEITDLYGKDEAHEVIRLAKQDYAEMLLDL